MFHYALFLILLIASPIQNWLYSEDTYKIIENQAKTAILTPSFSDRKTLKMQLANGLEVYLISDPSAIKSAAALTVLAGSWQDPPEYPGLAHFLEHMLFLGTEKYPIESDYDRFIKEHDGKSNAYTASDYTLYFFSINNDAFEEALDRFSYFFKKPLFNPSGVSRELQAIDQEFAKNFTDDDIREHYVLKELSNPAHPFHRFSAGNSSTLSKVSQKTLKQWYYDHYSANRMRLVVYSPLPLDTLKQLVIQDFKGIPNTNRAPFLIQANLLAEAQKGQIIYVNPLKDVRTLHLLWELPSRFANMEDTKPSSLACYVLGDEGPGSLLNELKKENLAESLDCQGYRLGTENALFSLSIDLTEEGLHQVNFVIKRVFEAIAHFQQQGLPTYIFNEIQKMNKIRYQYQSKQDPFEYVMQLGGWLAYENLSTFPEQSIFIQRFDSQAFHDLLNQLTPEALSIVILAKPEITGITLNRKENWMGVPYTIRPFTPEQIQEWKYLQINPNLKLPQPNPFIPEEPRLTTPVSTSTTPNIQIPQPVIILENEQFKVYYAKDEVFQVPKTMWFLEIKTPAIERSQPSKIVLADLYIKCLQETLNPYSYSASQADLDYQIQRTENGITLTISGYSDNAELLFNAILQHLKTCQPTEALFLIYKDSLMRQYQNFSEESALQQGLELFQSAIYENFVTHKQKALALQDITYTQLLNYLSHLFDKTYVTALFYGNIEKNQSLQLIKKLEYTLDSLPYPLHEQPVIKIISLSPDQGPFLIKKWIKAAGNATILGIEDAGFSFKTRAAQQILSQAMNGPFYSTLRTKQQTGYIVYNRAEEIEKHLFSLFAVQSNTHDPRDLLARFELFIEDFIQEMSKTDLTEEKFEIIRQSLLTTLEQPPQSLDEMGILLKSLAFKYEGDFNWISKRIQGFKELKYEDFLEIASQLMSKTNKRRLAVLVKSSLPENKMFRYIALPSISDLHKISQYTHIDLPE